MFRQLSGAELCHFRKGEIIIKAGEAVEYIYYLMKGSVYRKIIARNGGETIVTVKKADGSLEALVGVVVLYRKERLSNSDFIAKTDCTCYKIPAESYLAMANQNPEILLATIDLLM